LLEEDISKAGGAREDITIKLVARVGVVVEGYILGQSKNTFHNVHQ
jgi:hypothetical protein